MSKVQKLLSLGSEALAQLPEDMPPVFKSWKLGPELFAMLREKNGFYAFESALHVFPVTSDPGSGLEGWNSESLWRQEYKEFADGLLFFGEDVFQDQFCISQQGVVRFCAESGNVEVLASSIEGWADLILSDYSFQIGWKLAHDWQAMHGPLPQGKRLMPKTPFFLGGQFSLDNLWVGNSLEGMRFKGDLAMHTRDLPEGTKIRLRVAE